MPTACRAAGEPPADHVTNNSDVSVSVNVDVNSRFTKRIIAVYASIEREKFSRRGENCQRKVTDLAGSLVTSCRPPGRLQKRPVKRWLHNCNKCTTAGSTKRSVSVRPSVPSFDRSSGVRRVCCSAPRRAGDISQSTAAPQHGAQQQTSGCVMSTAELTRLNTEL